MKGWQRILAIAAGVILLPLIILVAYALLTGPQEEEKLEGEVMLVGRGTIQETIDASGHLEMPHQLTLGFRSGRQALEMLTIEKVEVKEGDRVREGEVLAVVDTTLLELDMAKASAAAEVAQAAYHEELEKAEFEIGSLKRRLDTSSAEVEAAQAAYEGVLGDYDVEHNYRDWIREANVDVRTNTGELMMATGSFLVRIINPGAHRAQRPLGIITGLASWSITWFTAVVEGRTKVDEASWKLHESIGELNSRLEYRQEGAAFPLEIVESKRDLTKALASLEDTRSELEYTVKSKVPAAITRTAAELVDAQASLEDARERLEGATIKAPFDGIIDLVDITEEERLTAEVPVMLLVDPTELEIDGIVDEIDALRVEAGQQAKIFLDALPEVELEGEVKAIATVATEEEGVVNYRVLITVEPLEFELKGGLTALAEIIVAESEEVLLVPNRAIKTTNEGPVVEIVVDEKAEERKVVLGISDGQRTEIVDGLVEGEIILVP